MDVSLCRLVLVVGTCFLACQLSAAFQHRPERVVEACQGRGLLLACPQGSVIRLQAIQLVDSRCFGRNCCPRRDDCSGTANTHYQRLAHVRCNGQPSCSLHTDRRRIPCGLAGFPVYNDYQRITFSCIDWICPIRKHERLRYAEDPGRDAGHRRRRPWDQLGADDDVDVSDVQAGSTQEEQPQMTVGNGC